MVCIRQATVNDLLQMQTTNLWCLPENYQVRSHQSIHSVRTSFFILVFSPVCIWNRNTDEVLFLPSPQLATTTLGRRGFRWENRWLRAGKNGRRRPPTPSRWVELDFLGSSLFGTFGANAIQIPNFHRHQVTLHPCQFWEHTEREESVSLQAEEFGASADRYLLMRVLMLFPASCPFLWLSNCVDEEITARNGRRL